MDSPALSAASSLGAGSSRRSPFVPVKRHRIDKDDSLDTPVALHTSGASLRPPVVPLTTSNLCRYTAALSNQQGEAARTGGEHGSEKTHATRSDAVHAFKKLPPAAAAAAAFSAPDDALPPSSPAGVSKNNNTTQHGGVRSLGHGLPSATALANRSSRLMDAAKPPASASSLLSAKRYTRQMAAPREEEQDNASTGTSGMLSASDLRVRARLTSGSAPRRKAAVPGAERADRPPSAIHARPETPSNQSRARARSITAATASRPVSVSIARTPSRPPCRAGGPSVVDGPPPQSISRPQSRMDDFPADFIISASSIDNEEEGSSCKLLSKTSNRRNSDSSVGTVVQRRQENVLVCVRVRPPAVAHTERIINPAHLEEAWLTTEDEKSIRLSDGTGHRYHFDALVTGSGNETVYDVAASDLIRSAMNGYDAVIFAYGQTASGKTFTLSGSATNPGIIPQAISDIFKYIRDHPKKEFLLRASYLEIYNEQLKDLLAPETAGQVKIRQDERKRFFVSPLREEVVTTEAHVAQLLNRGETNRHTGSTDYNTRSSRSHAVFQIVSIKATDFLTQLSDYLGQVIESRDIQEGSCSSEPNLGHTKLFRKGAPVDERAVVTSRLSLIDLAGSEKATSQADRRMEGAFINKSLLTLEKVIAALTEEKSRAHVPYRDSKLTQILQPSLSGEARVAVICTINPSPVAIQESTSTLKFAQRVKKVTLNAERNEIVGEKALLIRYEQTIAEMTAYIAQLEQGQAVTPDVTEQSGTREGQDDVLYHQSNRTVSNPQVLKAKEDRAKLQGFIVTAGNLDEQRAEGPRPITPLRPVNTAQLPLLQEQLLDCQDRVAELEELCEKQQDEVASLKAQLAARTVSNADPHPADTAIQALRKRNEELERQCREYRTILANEDQVTALKSERRLAAREWSEKLIYLQHDLDKARALQTQAVNQLAEEQKKTRRLEKTLLQSGLHRSTIQNIDTSPNRVVAPLTEGLDLLSTESPMLDVQGSYLNLDELLDSPTATPVRVRH